jgi:Fibronectin type III domain
MRFPKARATTPALVRHISADPDRRGWWLAAPARGCLAAALLAGTLAFTFAPGAPAGPGAPGRPMATAPGAPTGLTAAAAGSSQVTLSWTAPASTGGASLILYQIYEGTSPTALSMLGSVSAASTNTTLTGLGKGTVYYFAVAAQNSAKLSGPMSSTVSFPNRQTINFGPLSGGVKAGASFRVSATASSGLPVSFQSGTPGVCTVAHGTDGVTTRAPGTCTITASQAGDSAWLPATPVTRSLLVSPVAPVRKTQTISFRKPHRYRAGQHFAVSASATSGLQVFFHSGTQAVCTVAGSTVTAVAPGRCTITASQPGNKDWLAASPVTRSFRVKPALFAGKPASHAPLWLVIGVPAAAILAALVALLILRRRRPRPPAPTGQSVRVEPHPGPPRVVTVRTTGTGATHTVRVEPHPGTQITAVKETVP